MKHSFKHVAVLLCSFLCAPALAGQVDQDDALAKKAEPPVADAPHSRDSSVLSPHAAQYRIGESDMLAVNVWREPEISRAVQVRPDGRISLPLAGEIQATGLTVEELEARITSALKSVIENPAVTVIVQEARNQRFNILGEVTRPGSFVLTQPTTVLDALALAGGFRDFAKVKSIYVLRTNGGSSLRLPFNYKDVIKGKNLSQNIQLQPGDTIVVP